MNNGAIVMSVYQRVINGYKWDTKLAADFHMRIFSGHHARWNRDVITLGGCNQEASLSMVKP